MSTARTFSKNERLCNKTIINQLYHSPDKQVCFPLSIHWQKVDKGQFPSILQVVVVAPKRKLHHAVDRNRIKRLMRECWRLKKHNLIDLLTEKNICLVVGINYIFDQLCDYKTIDKALDKAIIKIIESLNNGQ